MTVIQKSTDRPVPWPKIKGLEELGITEKQPALVPLQEKYSMEDMSYLDSPEAYPLFEKQARIIKSKKYTGLLDIGCRHGPVNKILQLDLNYKEYDYYGIDTSYEPILIAKKDFANNPRINYNQQSWAEPVNIDFAVDCMIFSGVLLYIKDDNSRAEFFQNLMDSFGCKNAIIQEPYHFQRHWDDRLILNTITNGGLDFLSENYTVDEHYLDLPIFAGKRVIYDVSLRT